MLDSIYPIIQSQFHFNYFYDYDCYNCLILARQSYSSRGSNKGLMPRWERTLIDLRLSFSAGIYHLALKEYANHDTFKKPSYNILKSHYVASQDISRIP